MSPAPSAPETKSFFDDLSSQDDDRVYNWGEIEQQFATGEPVNWIHGDNSFILGLPLERIEMLLEVGVKVPTTVMLMPATGSDAASWGFGRRSLPILMSCSCSRCSSHRTGSTPINSML